MAHETLEKGHGRLECRAIRVSEEPAGFLDWPGLRTVYAIDVEKWWLRGGEGVKVARETQYGIASLSAPPRGLMALHRRHWSVENLLFRQRDEAFREDRANVRGGHSALNRAQFHNAALALLGRKRRSQPLPALQLAFAFDPLGTLQKLDLRL